MVTGVGVASSCGIGVAALWQALMAGRHGFVRAEAPAAETVVTTASVTGSLEIADETADGRRRRLNRSIELATVASAEASRDAGLHERPIAPPRLSAIFAVGPIDQYTADLADAVERAVQASPGACRRSFASQMSRLDPKRRLRHLPNIVTSAVAIAHGAAGPSVTLVSGDTAGIDAVAEAFALVRRGAADAVLCGGVDARLTPALLAVLVQRRDLRIAADPDGCRPFDRASAGMVPGEGAAVLVLERASSASARGARSYAEVAGGSSYCSIDADPCEALGRVLTVPVAARPGLIIANGSGVPHWDRGEAAAIGAAPGARHALVASVKGNIGHTFAAAGLFNCAVGCLTLAHNTVPPIAGLAVADAPLSFATRPTSADHVDTVVAVGLDSRGVASAVAFQRP